MRAAETGWCALAAGILVWELAAPENELLSDGVDRITRRHPILTRAAIIVTAAHLLRLLPARYDPFTQTAALTSRAPSWRPAYRR